MIDLIRTKYLTDERFTVENAKNASTAAAGMCKWIYAMSDYDRVAKVVAPKRCVDLSQETICLPFLASP